LTLTMLLTQQSMLFSKPAEPQAQPVPVEQAAQLLSANQLDNLVSPVALYPDPLLSQVLVACTYPLELVEASQWLQRNPGLTGTALTSAAAQQNWDSSIQALVVFPDLMKRLTEDITWTTSLGNAFLAQQADVMDAVQRMRSRAQQGSMLASTPQQTVTTTFESGRPVVVIAPAQPEVIYVPMYDPVWIWGPYVYYPYPRWHYPPRPVMGVVVIWGPPIIITNFFGWGWRGWNAWGWYPVWPTHAVMVNTVFIHHYNFNSLHLSALVGTTVWTHDAFHRLGVPYPNRAMTERYRAGARENLRPREPGETRPAPRALPQPRDRIGSREIPANPPGRNRGAFGSIENGDTARRHTDRGYSSLGRGTNPPPARQPGQTPPRGHQPRREH
jgi:hypothetical protein